MFYTYSKSQFVLDTPEVLNNHLWLMALLLDQKGLNQWFSKCGPWTSNITITLKLVRNKNSQSLPQIYFMRVSLVAQW